MGHREREPGDLIEPSELGKVLPFEPAATSAPLRWEGLEVVHFRATPAFEIDYAGQTHHGLTLFTRPPEQFALRFEGLTRHTPPSAGSIILVPSGIPVRARSSGFEDVLHVFLEPGVIERVAEEAFDLDPARVRIPPLDGLHHPQVRAIMLAVRDELTAEGGGDRFAVESLGNLLAVHLLRQAPAPRRPGNGSDGAMPRGRLRTVVEYIEDHLDAGLSLERLAAAARLSPYHFARQFKAATGLPPHQFVIGAGSSGPNSSWVPETCPWRGSRRRPASRARACSVITSSASSASPRADSDCPQDSDKGRNFPEDSPGRLPYHSSRAGCSGDESATLMPCATRTDPMSVETYQNLVIGSGVGGKLLAWTLAGRGQRTVVVERSMVGGSCPNVACLPSKNVIYSAKAVSLVNPSTGLGVVTGSVRADMAGVARRKRRMVEELVERHLDNFKASGAELVMGEARFTEPKTVSVAANDGGTRLLRGERVFINVGTRAAMPDVPGLALAGPMTHVEALDLERLPEHLVVLGGGYVGLEFAQAMRRFGSRVTIVQHGPRLLDREDPDVSDALRELMADEDIEVLLRTELLAVTGISGTGVRLRVRSGPTETTFEASDILVAAGRTPNTDRLDADRAGVELDARGYIRVNDRLQTSAPDVWAAGECAGSPQFTHVGEDDFRVILDNLNGGSRFNARPAHPVLPLHRPGIGPCRTERIRGPGRGRVLSHRPHGDGEGPADAHPVAAAWVHEGADRRRRPHPGFHGVRGGGERGDGGRPDGDARRPAVHGATRRDLHPPDRGGRIARPVRRTSRGPRAMTRAGAVSEDALDAARS